MAIIASLATYGVGYLARPLGAAVLGHWGDTRGRKNVLLLCMLLMGLSTMAVGLLPTYEDIGLLAPALLVVLRLVQGFAVAGEISGASSMIMEHAPFGRRGYYELYPARRAGRPGDGSGGVSAACLLHAQRGLQRVGLAHPVPDERVSAGSRVLHPQGGSRDAGLRLIGRRPTMIAGCLGSGLLALAYLYAISVQNVPLAFTVSVVMWGMIYQGYNAVFPSFYPELFHNR